MRVRLLEKLSNFNLFTTRPGTINKTQIKCAIVSQVMKVMSFKIAILTIRSLWEICELG